MNDLRIIPTNSGAVTFDVYGKSQDTGLLLLQRLYILLLASNDNAYRSSNGYTLLDFLEGGNIPDDSTMESILTICCADAVNKLDVEDRNNVTSFSATSTNGVIQCSLVLADGTTVKGLLNE